MCLFLFFERCRSLSRKFKLISVFLKLSVFKSFELRIWLILMEKCTECSLKSFVYLIPNRNRLFSLFPQIFISMILDLKQGRASNRICKYYRICFILFRDTMKKLKIKTIIPCARKISHRVVLNKQFFVWLNISPKKELLHLTFNLFSCWFFKTKTEWVCKM